MPTGPKPRVNSNPKEDRMITWRLHGGLHNRLAKICARYNISMNKLITEHMTKKVDEIEEKIELEESSE